MSRERRCNKWLQLSGIFRSRFPESVDFLECALASPDEFLSRYNADSLVDGHSYPEVFDAISDSGDVDPEDIFQQVFDWKLGVFAEVDWKASNSELYQRINLMLHGYGCEHFDWSFKDEHENQVLENYEFVHLVDKRLKGSGFRLAYFAPRSDSHAFAIVPDEYFRLASTIDPYG